MNKNNYQDLFKSFTFQHDVRPAVYLDYISVDNYASELLSGILGRDIYAGSERSEFYDWSIAICCGSIAEAELEILFGIIEADEHDREIQSYETEDDGSVTSLWQRISNKLFSKIMPFEVETSLADEDGIWFFGSLTDIAILKNNAEQISPK